MCGGWGGGGEGDDCAFSKMRLMKTGLTVDTCWLEFFLFVFYCPFYFFFIIVTNKHLNLSNQSEDVPGGTADVRLVHSSTSSFVLAVFCPQ